MDKIPHYELKVKESKEPSTSFEFISEGHKGKIPKLIKFFIHSANSTKGIYNLMFGDKIIETITVEDKIIETVRIDGNVVSNNGDGEKVFTTVIASVYAFAEHHPHVWVYFDGRINAITRIHRMLMTKYELKKDFFIFGLHDDMWVDFQSNVDFTAFVVKRRRAYCDRISIIPNGLTDMANTMSDKRLLRKKWNVSSKEKIILFAGRMDEIKGLEFLLNAFREVLKILPSCRLVIAGDGAYDKYIKASQDICTKISYTGLLNKIQLYEVYQIADVGVIPSLYESFGYVAVEMMMHGLPIVATATSGLNEVVDDYCGLKIPIIEHPDRVEIDINLLAEKIIYLLQNPTEAERISKNARKRYLEKYASSVFRENMLDFYRSLF